MYGHMHGWLVKKVMAILHHGACHVHLLMRGRFHPWPLRRLEAPITNHLRDFAPTMEKYKAV